MPISPDFVWTDEQFKKVIVGTIYENKICFCTEGYKASYLVDDFYNDKRLRSVMPDPPPCRNCQGWPKHNLNICGRCDKVYYQWFFAQVSLPTGHRQYCWDCSMKYGTFRQDFRPRTSPPACVLPKQESFAEIMARVDLDF